MPPLTPEAWAQIRADYEHGERTIHDICAAHGISTGTLRDRMRRWQWTRRRPPIAREGPPPLAPDSATPATAQQLAPHDTVIDPRPIPPLFKGRENAGDGPSELAPDDPAAVAERLQNAVARVLPAIEASLAKLASGPQRPREMEQTARALGVLMRTLRELKALLAETAAPNDGGAARTPEEVDAMRAELARRLNALLDARQAAAAGKSPEAAEPD